MAFFRVSIGGGGGSGSDIYLGQAPDAVWASNGSNLNNNAVATVAVTQKPRFIEVIMFANNAKEGLVGLYDVKKDKAYRFGYWSSSVQDSIWSNYSSYITSVTNSSVTVKQVYSSASVRTWVNCYYDNGGSSGGGIIDYNFVKNMVDNHTHTYEIVSTSSGRITVNEGGVYIDRSNKVVYMYLDFNIAKTETPSTHNALAQFSPTATVTQLMPANTSDDLGLLITEYTTETNTPRYNMIKSSGNAYIGTSKKYTSGNRSKIYGVWTLYTA